jgi:hypothetical protein
MSIESKNPGSDYLCLLRHAGLDHFEKLALHEQATIQERVEAANLELKLFEKHPDEKIVIHLQSHGDRQSAGPITIEHLPDAESHLWEMRGGRAGIELPIDGDLSGSDDFPLRQKVGGTRGYGLPGSDDFTLRKKR